MKNRKTGQRIAVWSLALSLLSGVGVFAESHLPEPVNRFIETGRPESLPAVLEFVRTAPSEEAVSKDVLLKRLSELQPLPLAILSSLCDILDDPVAEKFGRMYSAQYLCLMSPRYAGPDQDTEQARLKESLYRAVTDPDGELAGTALLQLVELDRHGPGWEPERMAAAALSALRNPESGPSLRMAALQSCAQLRIEEAKEDAWRILDAKPRSAEGICAIGLLGEIGDRSDIEKLNEPRYSHRRLRAAKEASRQRIEERHKTELEVP